MNIEIDDREYTRIESAKKQYTQDEIQIKHLETGDFIFNKTIAFEYKTMEDFIQSVKTGRVFEQALRLNKEFPYPYLIIEANDNQLENYYKKQHFLRRLNQKGNRNKYQKFYENQFYGAIASLNTLVTVIRCPTEIRCLKMMRTTAKKCLKTDEPYNRKIRKLGSPAYQFLRYCVRGIGPETANKIIQKTGAETLEDLLLLQASDIDTIKGISTTGAELIIQSIHG